MEYLIENPDKIFEYTLEHLQIVGLTILIAALIGVPLGILVTRMRWLERPVINAAGILYTIPSLALFAVLLPFTGLGITAPVIALTIYSLLAIIRNTVAGIDAIDPALINAARGMGMTGAQRLRLIELPLALPVILAGMRAATVATIGFATVAALFGAGGIGRLIFAGIRMQDSDRIVAGALVATALALGADALLKWIGLWLRRDLSAAR